MIFCRTPNSIGTRIGMKKNSKEGDLRLGGINISDKKMDVSDVNSIMYLVKLYNI